MVTRIVCIWLTIISGICQVKIFMLVMKNFLLRNALICVIRACTRATYINWQSG